MSLQTTYANKTIDITDLKHGDTKFIDDLSEPIAVLKRDRVKAYLISAQLMGYFMNILEEQELLPTVNQRLKELDDGNTQSIAVNIDEL